ncbi:efflux RND transporter periplasmic adaptor subunit [Fulvivirga sp. 29W222]|uniref:Efflux RND transporter periplasmic adaptor subunit n=1 Tax=Fulvivirga marina TaxID=2494733 RepID=A0A937FY60_9BACT|nr:efflux RND transporter periplasmic adaptor subunit [Fulvivirga marina]MBL6447148.1 efflux RND transporter periplasmic adaptor subunit [Fulvivirga marina]
MKKILENKWVTASLALAMGLFLGYVFWHNGSEGGRVEHGIADHADETIWTCSMHPQIRQHEPGKCPICGMDLIPLQSGGDNINPMAVSMTSTAVKLAGIQTIMVGGGEGIVEKSLQLNGTVVPDERLVKTLTAHVAGRIEQLFVNTTGEFVKRGQRLASIYSPELIAAQRELLQTADIKESQPALYKAAFEKLKAFKLSESQIKNIVESGEIRQTVDILADQSGVVFEKKVNVGDHLKTGEALYIIADLSKVWVEFDAYESDLPWIAVGDKVAFIVASLPGQKFEGKVAFIEPMVNRQSRVAQIRVEIPNPDQKLKPEMFATGTIVAKVSAEGGQITLPKSAVMWTGERSVVYVREKDREAPSFMIREVVLGPSLGSSYLIEAGLNSGDDVVVNGTFTVDAAAQLAGKPSMMNPQDGVDVTRHGHKATEKPKQVHVSDQSKKHIEGLITKYYKLKDALVASDKEEAIASAGAFKKQLGQVPMGAFKGKAHDSWMNLEKLMKNAVDSILSAGNIDQARKSFISLSEVMVDAAHTFGPFDEAVYVQHCPMANNDLGADWLSEVNEVRNPYYGDMMLTCGEVTETIE